MLIFFTDKEIASDDFIYKSVQEYCLLYHLDFLDFSLVRIDGKKPYMQPKHLCFNLSHSHNYTVCAISDKEVGIDLQHHRPNVDTVAISQRYLKQEIADYKVFYNYFAKAEASAKLYGTSLVKKLQIFDNDAQIIDIFPNYSLAVSGQDKDIYFLELYD